MAEDRNPSLAELNEAIAREHGIDLATLKDYRLPESRTDPRVLTGEGIPAVDDAGGETSRPDYLGIPRIADYVRASTGPLDPALSPPSAGGPHPRVPSVVPMHTRDSASCFSWTVEQLLEEMLRAIRAGEETPAGAILVYTRKDTAGRVRVCSWRAQVGWCEEYTYLEVAQQDCLATQRVPG